MNLGKAGIVVLIVGLVLTGCSQAGEPAPAVTTVTPTPADPASVPDPSPSPTPASFVTPTAAPVMPAEAKEITPEGAEAFTRWWIDSYNWMLTSGDENSFIGATATVCEACQVMRDEVRLDREKGTVVHGGIVALRTVRTDGAVSRERTDVRIQFHEQAVRKTAVDGSVRDDPELDATRVVVLVADEKGWLVAGVADL